MTDNVISIIILVFIACLSLLVVGFSSLIIIKSYVNHISNKKYIYLNKSIGSYSVNNSSIINCRRQKSKYINCYCKV